MHVPSLSLSVSSVKVVRHKPHFSCCGKLWKKDWVCSLEILNPEWSLQGNRAEGSLSCRTTLRECRGVGLLFASMGMSGPASLPSVSEPESRLHHGLDSCRKTTSDSKVRPQ